MSLKLKSHHFYLAKKWLLVLLVFTIFKIITFIAPLGVNYVVNSLDFFGEFEYSLNLGQTIMGIVSFGLAGSYAYFIVRMNKAHLKPIFHLHFFTLISIITFIAIIYPPILSSTIYTSFNVAIVIANQVFLSSILKLKGKNNFSIIVDSTLYIVIGLVVTLQLIGILKFTFFTLNIALIISSIISLFFIHFRELSGLRSVFKKEIIDVYKFGLLIVIATPLLLLITSGTRLYIDYFLEKEDVGLYSYFLRIASASLILSRVFIILMYRKLFTSDHEELDKKFSTLIYLIFIINILVFFIAPLFLIERFDFFKENWGENQLLFLLCLFQIVFWVTSSLFEPVIQRENKQYSFIILLACSILLLFISLQFNEIFSKSSIESIVILNCIVIFLLVLGQIFILTKHKALYYRSLFAHGVVGVSFIATLLLVLF